QRANESVLAGVEAGIVAPGTAGVMQALPVGAVARQRSARILCQHDHERCTQDAVHGFASDHQICTATWCFSAPARLIRRVRRKPTGTSVRAPGDVNADEIRAALWNRITHAAGRCRALPLDAR